MDNQILKIEGQIKNEKRIAIIATQSDVDFCLNQNKRVKRIIDLLENIRLDAVREILLSKKRIDDKYKVLEAPLLALIQHNKKNLEEYMFVQEAERAKELKEETGFSKSESKNLSKIETKQETGISYRNDWDLEITDINLVPDKFIIKTLDEKAIKEHLKNGGTFVKGVKITPKKIIITK